MNIPEFQARWRDHTTKESTSAKPHFLDLCAALGMPTPAEIDKDGAFYTFEKGAVKTGGGQGFADVWWDGRFGWEYKGRGADLRAAYNQLLQYKDDLNNPPLFVVCDLFRFQVHTNFTGLAKLVYAFTLDDFDQPSPVKPGLTNLDVLRAVFTDPDRLKPGVTVAEVTEQAAARFGALAASLHARGYEPPRIAHFLVQLLFALFAEDVGLLPKGIVGELLRFTAKHPERFPAQAAGLFAAMRDGGDFSMRDIAHFNGGLFATVDPLPLTAPELAELARAASLDWGSVEPAIFGTLFERSLDPAKRAQLGAHYTGKADIERVVEPVVMTPLRRRWAEVKVDADRLKTAWDAAKPGAERERRRGAFAGALFAFQEELARVRILDPACGSGNFLYVALAKLKDLEKEIVTYGGANGLPAMLPIVGPHQLFGLEINEYAHELAQVVVWIGHLQWGLRNGFPGHLDPILEPLDSIKLQDALLDLSDPAHPKEARWPEADFIIGNPPFLGGNKVRQELGSAYLDELFQIYDGRVPRFADLVCYFFEKARVEINEGRTRRAGLLATNSIRGGVNRRVLDRIKETGDIFVAWDDEPWVLNGAAVRISIVGFDSGEEQDRCLDGVPTKSINSDLTATVDVTAAKRLPENAGISFTGIKKTGPFDVTGEVARHWLELPVNPNGRSNRDVVRPVANGLDVTRRPRDMWIVDFGVNASENQAALYEAPFEYVRTNVLPERAVNRDPKLARLWWLHERSRPEMRAALVGLRRCLVTPGVATYRSFVWLNTSVLPDHQLNVFAREDDYFFGVLHSRAHEVWSLRMGTWLGVGNDPRYTPTTCFETFPFPWPPGAEPPDDPRAAAIAAAKALEDLRRAWLDPEGATPEQLRKRTLTALYNERPTWLAHAHARLDRAVWSAYAWADPDPATTPEDAILSRLLALNGVRDQGSGVRAEKTPTPDPDPQPRRPRPPTP